MRIGICRSLRYRNIGYQVKKKKKIEAEVIIKLLQLILTLLIACVCLARRTDRSETKKQNQSYKFFYMTNMMFLCRSNG